HYIGVYLIQGLCLFYLLKRTETINLHISVVNKFERKMIMVDRCNRLLIIGQNDLLKHYLEKYFLSKDYQLIQSINEHKSFIPIIIHPFNEELGTDADVTLLALNKMKRNQKTYLPELAF